MSEEHGQIVIGFRQSEVPPTTKFNPLGHFQAGSAGRAWIVRKSSISATTFTFVDSSILAMRPVVQKNDPNALSLTLLIVL